MATYCVSLISAGIVPNCDDPITKGYEHKGIIINWDDIDFTATTFSGTNTISDLVLKDGKKAYEIVQRGNTPYTGSTSELAVGTISNTVTKNVQFTILNKGPKIAETVIDPLFSKTHGRILVPHKVRRETVPLKFSVSNKACSQRQRLVTRIALIHKAAGRLP